MGLKHVKRPSIAKGALTAMKVLNSIFFRTSGPLMQIAIPKGMGVSGSLYKNVVLKKISNKNEKSTSKNWFPACPFGSWQCPSPQVRNWSSVFEVWKGQCIVAPSIQPRPGPVRCFPLHPPPPTEKKAYLVGDIGVQNCIGVCSSPVSYGFTQRLVRKFISKIGLKRL